MRGTLLILLFSLAASCSAVNVGIFDDSRLYSPIYNMQTGAAVAQLRAIWQARGAVWRETNVLSEQFLSQVSVFYTSQILQQNLTSEEQNALRAWVQAGGTLVVTGDCG